MPQQRSDHDARATGDSRPRIGPTSDPLVVIAGVLFIVFVISLVGLLTPPSLLNAAWQLRLVSTLVSYAYLPLLALVLIDISGRLGSQTDVMQGSTGGIPRNVARWAVLASLGFVLLVPLNASALWRVAHSQTASLEVRRPEVQRRLRAMEEAIEGATDARALQTRLTMMQGPTIAPQDMSRPLPELKQMLLKALGKARSNLQRYATEGRPDTGMWAMIQESIRLSVASLGFAVAFAAYGRRPGTGMTLLDEWVLFQGKRRSARLQKKLGLKGPGQ